MEDNIFALVEVIDELNNLLDNMTYLADTSFIIGDKTSANGSYWHRAANRASSLLKIYYLHFSINFEQIRSLTDTAILYNNMVKYLNSIKSLWESSIVEEEWYIIDDGGKVEDGCKRWMQVFNHYGYNIPVTQPEPRQEQPQKTRGRGRPKETLKDKMIDDTNGEKLQQMHTKLDGKKGKDATLIILACIKKGWLTRPTYSQVKNEFGNIGSKTGYNRYLNEKMFTKEELEGATNSLD